MAEVTTEELATLQREFDWLLAQEVHFNSTLPPGQVAHKLELLKTQVAQ